MKFLAQLLVAATVAAPVASALAAGPAKPDLIKGKETFTAVCAACHGEDGNSTIAANPSLAQQFPAYLLKQLQEFKSGKRDSAIMKPMAEMLSDEDMVNVSAWLGTQKAATGVATQKDLVAMGERIWRGGIAERQIAACAACHSPNGGGIPAQYPRLGGQHAEYTAAQLTAFRDGVRTNSPHMRDVAAKLNDREIRAVADYVAGLR